MPYRANKQNLEQLKVDFVNYMKYTFGDSIRYIGTTTDLKKDASKIKDIDVMIVFESMSESTIAYSWKIINRLHAKYNIFIDARLNGEKDLLQIPSINKYLLRAFLNNLHGENPFSDFEISKDELDQKCINRIKEQKEKIIKIIPRIADDSGQISAIAQCVFDAVRAFLIIKGTPIADKEDAYIKIMEEHSGFSKVEDIYNGYLDPNSVVDIAEYILDSVALVKHLYFNALKKEYRNEVLLINTPSSLIRHPRNDYLKYDHNMPLGLVCLSAYLKQHEITVKILDAYAENLDVSAITDRIFAGSTIPKIIGINTSSPNINIVHKIANYVKQIDENIIIVCGGSHASLDKDQTLSTGDVDYVVVGDGEEPLLQIVQKVLGNEDVSGIPGVFYRMPGKIIGLNNSKSFDISNLPAPDFESLPLEKYFAVKRRVYIHTSRGCGGKCIFCSVPEISGGKIRELAIETIEDHIERILGNEKYCPDEIQIVDDNFSHENGRRIRKFCQLIDRRKWTFKWKCQVRADQLNKELIEMMARSGCFEINMGIESGDEETQKYIGKKLNLEKTANLVSCIKKNQIKSKAFFMLGFPEESYEQINNTINYAIKLKRNGLDDVAVFPVMPFPGTKISNLINKKVYQGALIVESEIFSSSFSEHRLKKYSAKPEVSLNSNFEPDDLRLLVKFAYEKFEYEKEVENLKKEFNDFKSREESEKYGIF